MKTEFLEKWLRESIRAQGWKQFDHLHVNHLYRSVDKKQWLHDGLRCLQLCNRYLKDQGHLHITFVLGVYIVAPYNTVKLLRNLKEVNTLQENTPPALYLFKADTSPYIDLFGKLEKLSLSGLQEEHEAYLSQSPAEGNGTVFIRLVE